jgi:hypothetical protein
MGGRSSIKTLPQPVLDAVHAAIKAGSTIDEIVALLGEAGQERSRAAVGRYTKDYREMASHQRDLSSVARSFAGEFGDADNAQQKLLIQLFTSIMTRAVMPIASGEEVDLDGLELSRFARSIKDITGAAKIDTDREAKIREEERKSARAEAAKDAERAARGAGATPETLAAIKRELLGIS